MKHNHCCKTDIYIFEREDCKQEHFNYEPISIRLPQFLILFSIDVFHDHSVVFSSTYHFLFSYSHSWNIFFRVHQVSFFSFYFYQHSYCRIWSFFSSKISNFEFWAVIVNNTWGTTDHVANSKASCGPICMTGVFIR